MADDLKETLLETIEASLAAQLQAVRRLRRRGKRRPEAPHERGLSQLDMAYHILSTTGGPLHVRELIEHIQARYGKKVDRESLVSALAKRVARGDRFERPAPNTFGTRSAT